MQEYKITKVSQQEPREWNGPNGTVYYIKVMLEGHDKPVSIGKKKPDALKEGFTVYGTIEPTDLPEDKFKAAQNPNGGYSGSKKPAYNENGQKHGAALKIAADFLIANKVTSSQEEFVEQLQALSSKIFAIKTPIAAGESEQSGYEKAKAVAAKLPKSEPERSEEEYQEALGYQLGNDEPINLDDIPF